jgi:hypothetical protein
MYCTLIITRYPKHLGFFGFISMALFRFPLWFDKKIKFWKLMGSGKNGTFDLKPDLNQWALLFTSNEKMTSLPSFIIAYWKYFRCDLKQITMQPAEGHGLWDGKEVFGPLKPKTDYGGPVAVLTRATIRLKRLRNFWSNVNSVADEMSSAEGFIISYGIGELPWIKQATFSVWKDRTSMKAFAYNTHHHSDVIRKTRQENWYKEEMFVRFRIISATGFSKDIEAKLCNLQPSYEEA